VTGAPPPPAGAHGGGAPVFPAPWCVQADADVGDLRVMVPGLRWLQRLASMGVDRSQARLPEYLRLDMRRKGFRRKLAPKVVSQAQLDEGVADDVLLVPQALSAWCPAQGTQVKVSVAKKAAFNWFRLNQSSALLIGAVGIPVGGTLIGVGAAPAVIASPVVAAGLVVAGAVVAGSATVAAGWAAWRARR
jgi:hypothetical protein